jgi:hypothetical protein
MISAKKRLPSAMRRFSFAGVRTIKSSGNGGSKAKVIRID